MGWLLLIPFFLIRFGLLATFNKAAVKRAAYFAPLEGGEKAAYWLYQGSNAAIVLGLVFLKIQYAPVWRFSVGLAVYALGLILLALSTAAFAAPAENGFSQRGIYRLSRNPMYVAYFACFTGCALLTRSWGLFGCVLVLQISGHWIILSEERWCVRQFGEAYLRYQERVRRYL